jgi:hypothetical protein
MPDPQDRNGSTFPAWLVMGFALLNLLALITELALNVGKALISGAGV